VPKGFDHISINRISLTESFHNISYANEIHTVDTVFSTTVDGNFGFDGTHRRGIIFFFLPPQKSRALKYGRVYTKLRAPKYVYTKPRLRKSSAVYIQTLN
jgi:hypothetical protein